MNGSQVIYAEKYFTQKKILSNVAIRIKIEINISIDAPKVRNQLVSKCD